MDRCVSTKTSMATPSASSSPTSRASRSAATRPSAGTADGGVSEGHLSLAAAGALRKALSSACPSCRCAKNYANFAESVGRDIAGQRDSGVTAAGGSRQIGWLSSRLCGTMRNLESVEFHRPTLALLRRRHPYAEPHPSLPDDECAAALMDLAASAGVHDLDFMPFTVPWTRLESPHLQQQGMQHCWRDRADLTPEAWDLPFAVYDGDRLAGVQGVGAKHFAVTGTVGTGPGSRGRRRGRASARRCAQRSCTSRSSASVRIGP